MRRYLFINDEAGFSGVEYGVLVALISVTLVTFWTQIGLLLADLFETIEHVLVVAT